MARDHFIAPTAPSDNVNAVRAGAGNATVNNWTTAENGKFAKLVGESRYDLCAVGDKIEAYVAAVELATQNGYTIAGVLMGDLKNVTFDGLEATPGTGAVAIGDYVVTGTPAAKGTALTEHARVCKATNQPGTAIVSTVGGADTAAAIKVQIDAALVKEADARRNVLFAWRVVSLGPVGTGAIGTAGVVQRVNC